MTKVSIIIPVYNGSNYLARALDSALAQTYENIEIIVVNDGSTDDGATETIALSYGDNIRYFSKPNGGVASALNLGIEKMTGEYFSWLSHDDEYYPNKIQTQMDFLVANHMPEDVVLFSDWDIINSDGAITYHVVSDPQQLEQKPFYSVLRSRIQGCTLLIPRTLFFKIAKFDETLRTTQDYALWFKMLLSGIKFIHLPQSLVKGRYHTEQDTHKNPVANIEANELWVRFALDTPLDTMIQYEGSVEKFYCELAAFLFTTPYTYAANFVRGLELTNSLKNVTTKQPVKLIFGHLRGGGAEFFLQEHLLDSSLIILVRGIGNSSPDNVEIISNKNIIAKYTFTEIAGLLDTLRLVHIDRVDINHVISLDNLDASLKGITEYIIDKKLQAAFYLHDYFSLCPTITLINNKSMYCGLPTDENICNQCLLTNKLFLNYPLPQGVSIKEWRKPFLSLLQACSEIFVFSDSSKKLLLKCYPELVKHVYDYKLNRDILPKIVNKVDFSDKKIINIGVLGLIQATKGLWKLEELAKFIKILELPMRLTIVGAATEIIENVHITGEYSRDDLAKIVANQNIDLFVIPSIWPETYCYTADEVIQMGYPLICFDIGAPPERVSQYEHGYLAKEINSYCLLERIIEVAKIYNFKYFEMMEKELVLDKLINFINETNKKKVKPLQSENFAMHIKLGEFEARLQDKDKLLHLKEIELQNKVYELHSLMNSNSWKLMAPLRFASKTIKRLSIYKLARIKYYVIEGLKNPNIIINKVKSILQSVRSNKLIKLNTKRKIPIISVVIPIYDRTQTLKESIDSILKQTYKDFELILVCDGSPKETLKIVKSYEMNPRVRIFYFNNNSGNAVRGRNKAIKEALGQYLAFQDSDDIAEPTRLEKSLFYMEKHKADVVYGGWRALIEDRDIDLVNGQEVFSPDCDFDLLKEICVPCQSTVMAKLAALRDVGGLKPEMRYREDHELWLRLAHFGYKFKSIQHILISLRLHGNNLELAHKDNDLRWKNLMLETYMEKNKLKPKIGYILPDGGIGGGVAVVCNHTNHLLERGYDVSIYLEDNSTQISWFPNQKVNVFGVNQIPDNLDILVATHWTTVYTARKIPAKEKYYFIQSDERRFYPEFSEAYYKVEETYKFEDFKFITMAGWMLDWLKKDFERNAAYVPNGINLELFKKLENMQPTNKIRVLVEGPLNIPFKGMDEAFRVLKDLDCEVWCVSSAGELKKEWRCDRFFEKMPMAEMPAIYSSCDILLKMSRVESFCYPPLEMMACGGTVVIGRVTGIEEYIKDGYNALVVEAGDIEGAKAAVNKLIANAELRKELITNGIKTAQMWTWGNGIDALEKIFYFTNEN